MAAAYTALVVWLAAAALTASLFVHDMWAARLQGEAERHPRYTDRAPNGGPVKGVGTR